VKHHQKKPWWKNRMFLLILWPVINIAFVLLTLGTFSWDLNQSYFMIHHIFLFALGWVLFLKFLNPNLIGNNHEIDVKSQNLQFKNDLILDQQEKFTLPNAKLVPLLFLAVLIIDFFFRQKVFQDLLLTRNLGIQWEDLGCFFHSMSLFILPLLCFFIFKSHFFMIKINQGMRFFILSLGMLIIGVMDIHCLNKEFWHLFFGHYQSLWGMYLLFIFLGILFTKIKWGEKS
jgi:hypothetical protein